MRGISGIACTIIAVAAMSGCQGAEPDRPGPAGAGRSGGPAAQQPPVVSLPEDAAALAGLLRRQTRAMPTVRVAVTIDAGGEASVEMTGTLHKPAGQQPAATFTTVETGGKDPGTTRTIVVGGAAYTKLDGQEYARGKPWLRISRHDLDNADLGEARQTFEAMLNEVEQAVRQASADAGLTVLAHGEITGSPRWERLDATPVRRYSGTSDTKALADRTGDHQFRQMASGGVRDLPWTIWVDKYGLPRQFASTVAIPNAGTITTKAVYSGWGQPVTITPPPAAQVATVSD